MNYIDLRSDTVTQPTPEMRKIMANAICGDDVWEEDPTVKELEELSAAILGKEAALFTPSGTMSNLISVLTWCNKGDEILLGSESHIFVHEVGGSAALAGVMTHTVQNDLNGNIDPFNLKQAIREQSIHSPKTGLIALENTHNRCGGSALNYEKVYPLLDIAHASNIPTHLDGARIFNAAIALDTQARTIANGFDSVSFCISKGLSAPIGSVLCGSKEFINQARRWRKMLGGGMRQVGIIASAGIFALNNMVDRLKEDHQNAHDLYDAISEMPEIEINWPTIPTNILILNWNQGPVEVLINKLKSNGLLVSNMGNNRMRMVTHYGINKNDIDQTIDIIFKSMKQVTI